MEARHEQRFRAQDVADAGDQALIEQRVADRPRCGASQAGKGGGAVEARVGQVRPQRGNRTMTSEIGVTHELGDRHVEGHRRPRRRVDPDAHRAFMALPALARPVEMP